MFAQIECRRFLRALMCPDLSTWHEARACFCSSTLFRALMCFWLCSSTLLNADEKLQPTTRCGPNALLMYLEIHGVEFDHEEVLALPLSEEGASLLQLRDCANEFGFAAEVRKYEISEVDDVPLPALSHSPAGNGFQHFYVWYRTTEDAVFALDGTTGETIRINKRKLPGFWTGYAIVGKESLLYRSRFIIGCANALLFTFLAIDIVRRSRRSSLTAGLCFFLMMPSGGAAADSTERSFPDQKVSDSWRDPNHGGINSIYILAGMSGADIAYADALAALPGDHLPSTLDEMLAASDVLGIPCSARMLTADELSKIDLPVILHLDGLESGSGAYIVATRRFPTDLEYVNGPSATIHYLRYEDLMRKWSGVALIPEGRSGSLASMGIGLVAGLGIVWVAGFAVCRVKERNG